MPPKESEGACNYCVCPGAILKYKLMQRYFHIDFGTVHLLLAHTISEKFLQGANFRVFCG